MDGKESLNIIDCSHENGGQNMIDEVPGGHPRRQFLKMTGSGLLAALAASFPLHVRGQESRQSGSTPPPVQFPPIKAPTEQQGAPPPAPLPPEQRVGFAIVGLGRLSLEELMPAFGECKLARPTAVVSGDREKARRVARQYGLPEPGIYTYDTYDRIADNPDVQSSTSCCRTLCTANIPYAAREPVSISYARRRWRHRYANAKR
jgi:hypothetical protein